MNEIRELGDYIIIKQIGQGALGAVYLAEHRFMKKQFALKVLPEDLSSDRTFIQRFEDEVSQISILEHPHIVKIHNVSYDKGQYFLVTDCVVDEVGETTNLSQYIHGRGDHLAEDEIFRLMQQIADALDYAHTIKGPKKGIAHRGIKLNNILVSQGNEGVSLYLSDFGLSKIVGTGTFLTRTFNIVAESLGVGQTFSGATVERKDVSPLHASFLQSYQFLAPEQKDLDSIHPVDTKVDVYAFGVLAYYLLMGEFPEGYLEMPSERIKPLKYAWDQIIMQCLQKDPNKRPAKLTELLKTNKSIRPSQVPHPTAESMMQPQANLANSIYSETAPQEQKVIHSGSGVETPLRPVFFRTELERPHHDPDPAAMFEVDSTVKHYTPELREEKPVQPILTDMIVVEGGAFYRGSSDGNRDEMPRHQVTIDSFALDIHPVTNEQFVRFLEIMEGVKDNNHNDIIRLKDSRINSSKGKFSIESGYLKHPVVGVTWYGAVAYAKWIGKRLPTEAEWEIALCGGLEDALFPTGKDIEKTQANFFSADTIAVMSYPPNGYGFYDLAGNVYEWCQDWYGYNYYEVSVQEPTNPKGPLQGVYRVLRGGCWKSLKEDLRCSRRHRNNPGTVNGTYGFRCATDVQ